MNALDKAVVEVPLRRTRKPCAAVPSDHPRRSKLSCVAIQKKWKDRRHEDKE